MREWIVHATTSAYGFLLPFAWLVFLVSIVLLLPMAFWRKTRPASAIGLMYGSYVVGATTWFLGAAITFLSYGWLGLIIGLVLLGVGVVPLAIIGAFFIFHDSTLALSILAMVFVTIGMRVASVMVASKSSVLQD